MINQNKKRFAVLVLSTVMCWVSAAQAQPARPIRIVSPFATASVSDLTLRLLAERLGPRLNTSVIIENQPTGGGIAAARAVLTAPTDGNTLALLSNASAVSVTTFKKLPYDPVNDFVPVAGISQFAYIILSNDQEGSRSFREFLDMARTKPGVLNVGTAAPGTTPHLIALLLKKEAGIDFAIIPFKGAADLSVALMRKDVHVFINAYGAVRENLRQKQMRAIATTSSERSKLLPEVPTIQETGVRGFDVSSWNGLFAPNGSPAPYLARIGQELHATLVQPEVNRKLLDLGIEVWPSNAAELGAKMRAEVARWGQIVKDAGLETN